MENKDVVMMVRVILCDKHIKRISRLGGVGVIQDTNKQCDFCKWKRERFDLKKVGFDRAS